MDTDGTGATIKYSGQISEFTVFYRSREMTLPHLVYAEHPQFPDEIAVHASLVPTFERTTE